MEEIEEQSIKEKPYHIVEIINETPDVKIFRFRADDGHRLNFTPGMFVMLSYIDPQTKEKITRAYSIASPPGADVLEFYITMAHGKLTSKLEAAKVGDIYEITGPYGQFKFNDSEKKVLFLGGGCGVAPFISMLREIKERGIGTDTTLIYSVRFPYEIVRKAELEAMAKEMGLKLVVTVTRPAPGDQWSGQTGHIDQEMIKKYVADAQDRTAYVCGPLAFTKALKDALIALGCKEDKIHADVWG